MDIRKNLAQNLTDEKTIKKYLRKDKLSNFDLLKFAYRPFKDNFKIILSLIVYPLVNGIIPVAQAFIMYFLVELIEKNTDLRTMVFIILAYAFIIFIASLLSNQIVNRTYATYMDERLNFFLKAAEKSMKMDYGLGENSKFMAEFTRGYEGFSNNLSGLEGIYHDMYDVLSGLVSFIIIALILVNLSPLIGVFAIISIGVQLIIRNYLSSYKHKHMGDLKKVKRKTDRYYEEASDFNKAKDIRLFSFKESFIEGFPPLIENVVKISKKYIKPDLYLSPILAILLVGIEALAFYFLTGRIIEGSILLKNLTLAITSVSVFTGVILNLVIKLADTRSNLRYLQDGADMINIDLESTNGYEKLDGPLSIVFEDVSFSYPLSDDLVLKDLSFEIKSEEKVAIVGVNGAGKSTIVSLILGLYKPTKGKIYINGIDSDEIDLKSRFYAFATVLQNVEPLAVTIAENVAATDKNIDRDRVIWALREAGLGYKLDDLARGIDTPMTKNIDDEGTLFSGGENQKLAIARALYKKDAGCLIMDEPTAALDALAEEKIYREIDQISDGKTLVFISHRLASTRFCDKIMVLDGGYIKEYGSHEELLKKGSLYQKMYRTQEKYYKEEKDGK